MINNVPKIKHTESGQFFLIAGPCAIEDESMALNIAEKINTICDNLKIPYIFKGMKSKKILLLILEKKIMI
jgi:2-dehydro-3-deoxyphosphooctonate aldolase (KDO 8-P synthase)